jgi:hypothetical protein
VHKQLVLVDDLVFDQRLHQDTAAGDAMVPSPRRSARRRHVRGSGEAHIRMIYAPLSA